MPGPPPTPTAVLKMRGSWRADLRTDEPQAKPGTPRCPKNLNSAQRAVWKAICAILRDMEMLTTADGAQLERYAVMYVRWRKCLAFIEAKDEEHGRQGMVVPPGCYPMWSKDSDTYVAAAKDGTALIGFVEYPAVRESHRLNQALYQIEQQFGLTPAARAKLKAPTKEQKDDFGEYLDGGKKGA